MGTGVSLSPQQSFGLAASESEGTMTSPLSLLLKEEEEGVYTDFNGHTSRYALNDRGQFTKLTDPLERETNIKRDEDGNQTELMTPRRFIWDYTYDSMGNQTLRKQRETGNETRYTFEPDFNQVTSHHKTQWRCN